MSRYTPTGKDRRILKLWNVRGMRDLKKIAKKLGFQDLDAGEIRVKEALERNKIKFNS